MKKWITAVLAVMLLAALSLSLSLYFNDQRLNQEVTALKRQSAQYLQERDDQATVAASRRVDLVSTIAQQKTEIERVQKLLENEQQNAQKLAQSVITGDGQDSATATSNSSSIYQTDLESVSKDIGTLQSVVNRLKINAATLEKNLNVPSEVVAAPAPTNPPLPLISQLPNQGNNPLLNSQLLSISQDLNQLGNDLQSLLQRYSRLETLVGGNTFSRLNTDTADSNISAISGSAAEKLAAGVYAPHGWPVKGPVTSAFGPRPSIAPQLTQAAGNPKTDSSDKPLKSSMGIGGDPGVNPSNTPLPATATPLSVPDGVRSVGPSVTPLAGGSSAATPPTATTSAPAKTTATTVPTQSAASPTPVPILPTKIPTSTAAPTATPATKIGATPTPANASSSNGSVTSSGLQVGPGMEFHTGIDIGVQEGTQVHATADGVVEYAGNERGGYGNVVFINHAGGFVTIYGHNSRLLVKAGQIVKAGDVIALSGSTGYSTGPHVHYEIRYWGQIVDPAPFMN